MYLTNSCMLHFHVLCHFIEFFMSWILQTRAISKIISTFTFVSNYSISSGACLVDFANLSILPKLEVAVLWDLQIYEFANLESLPFYGLACFGSLPIDGFAKNWSLPNYEACRFVELHFRRGQRS